MGCQARYLKKHRNSAQFAKCGLPALVGALATLIRLQSTGTCNICLTCACRFDVEVLTLASAVCAALLLPSTQINYPNEFALAHSILVKQGASHMET